MKTNLHLRNVAMPIGTYVTKITKYKDALSMTVSCIFRGRPGCVVSSYVSMDVYAKTLDPRP